MKPSLKGVVFISKSLLWSVMLYVACMLAINWDQIHVNFNERPAVVQHVKLLPQAPVATIVPAGPIPQTSMGGNETVFSNATIVLRGLYKVVAVFAK